MLPWTSCAAKTVWITCAMLLAVPFAAPAVFAPRNCHHLALSECLCNHRGDVRKHLELAQPKVSVVAFCQGGG